MDLNSLRRVIRSLEGKIQISNQDMVVLCLLSLKIQTDLALRAYDERKLMEFSRFLDQCIARFIRSEGTSDQHVFSGTMS